MGARTPSSRGAAALGRRSLDTRAVGEGVLPKSGDAPVCAGPPRAGQAGAVRGPPRVVRGSGG
eukprot:2832760-Pyramimonas_sp.AAC.1